MPFQKLLGELIERVPGARGAILADWEGEAVDQVARMDTYELKVMGAHKGVILNNLREILERLESDQLQEIVVTTALAQTLIMPVTHEYFLVLTLDKGDTLGRALFEARRCVALLKQEIA
ncbi:GTPase [Desulfuromonas versatilis]|uniref:GTPase n=1 Tax=Desulfuromonas versatilis TaxID=2802975 RepID=A0ABN6DYG4_9BACT|nr:roadblock/LC7 domain-containing protein [Desulfuromonas versatilis]BCR04166.1 GTPase [Desulfuromonas versatilis]